MPSSPTTGKQQIEYIGSLYARINKPEWYQCIRILKSNYDQFGVDTSISLTKLLVGNIKHFKTRESRQHDFRVLQTCHKQLRGSNRDVTALAKEIMKQMRQYQNVLKRRQTMKRGASNKKSHKRSRRFV
jgi:hypothetical protein